MDYIKKQQDQEALRKNEEAEEKAAIRKEMIRTHRPENLHWTVLRDMAQEIANQMGVQLSGNSWLYSIPYEVLSNPDQNRFTGRPDTSKRAAYQAIFNILPDYYDAVLKDTVSFHVSRQYTAGDIPDLWWTSIMDQPDGTLFIFDDTQGKFGRPTGFIKIGTIFYPYFDKILGSEMQILSAPYGESKIVRVRATSYIVFNFRGTNIEGTLYPGTKAASNPNKYFDLKKISGDGHEGGYLPDPGQYIGIPGTEQVDSFGNPYYDHYVDMQGNQYRLMRPKDRLDDEAFLEQISGDPAKGGYQLKPAERKALKQKNPSAFVRQNTADPFAVSTPRDGESIDQVILKGIENFMAKAGTELGRLRDRLKGIAVGEVEKVLGKKGLEEVVKQAENLQIRTSMMKEMLETRIDEMVAEKPKEVVKSFASALDTFLSKVGGQIKLLVLPRGKDTIPENPVSYFDFDIPKITIIASDFQPSSAVKEALLTPQAIVKKYGSLEELPVPEKYFEALWGADDYTKRRDLYRSLGLETDLGTYSGSLLQNQVLVKVMKARGLTHGSKTFVMNGTKEEILKFMTKISPLDYKAEVYKTNQPILIASAANIPLFIPNFGFGSFEALSELKPLTLVLSVPASFVLDTLVLSSLHAMILVQLGVADDITYMGFGQWENSNTHSINYNKQLLESDYKKIKEQQAQNAQNQKNNDAGSQSGNNNNSGGQNDGKNNKKKYNWGNDETLQQHFDDHGNDFESKDKFDYAKKANDFYINKKNYLTKIDEEGIQRIYDPKTNTFGAYNPSGTTKTFFKPTGGENYFNNQPGNLIN